MQTEAISSQNQAYNRIGQQFQLTYIVSSLQGQCRISSITPLKFKLINYCVYILSEIFLFLPFIVTRWNKNFAKMFYYETCSVHTATHLFIINTDTQIDIVKVGKQELIFNGQLKQKLTFIHRYLRYIIEEDTVRLMQYDHDSALLNTLSSTSIEGLYQKQVKQLRKTFGLGAMIINPPPLLKMIRDQLIKPLCLFLIGGAIYWIVVQGYWVYATAILLIFIGGFVVNLRQMIELNQKIFAMAYYQVPVNVLREGEVKVISSIDVVPGDIVFLKDPISIPFQGIILQGNALVNECALTGQSVPVSKKADSIQQIKSSKIKINKSAMLIQGTSIIQATNKKKQAIFKAFPATLGMVVFVTKTNFLTTKGQLVRSILFPKQQQNKFQRQSYKFLAFLFCFAVFTFIVMSFWIFTTFQFEIFLHEMINIILVTVPPALPVSMKIGVIYALERLKKKQIYCIAPNRVISGGSIDLCCFDKTGTLTQDHMELYCVIPASKLFFEQAIQASKSGAIDLIQKSSHKQHYLSLLNNMATNHSITKVESTGELIGDPMEIKAFQFGDYYLQRSQQDQQAVFAFGSGWNNRGKVHRCFQFQADLQRMSVIATTTSTQGYYVYSKGAPEVMLRVMNLAYIPQNYGQLLRKYASHGFRVLALASKFLTLNKDEAFKCTRKQAESNLIFNGFQVFQNPLKVQTTSAIKQLREANLECVMITGDNTLTGANISYKCGISDKNKSMIIIDQFHGQITEESFIFNTANQINIIHQLNQTSPKAKTQSYVNNQQWMEDLVFRATCNNLNLCLTGRAFEFLQRQTHLANTFKKLLQKVTVFARTKPQNKSRIVMAFQQMGRQVSMCGDGANDCGALKQADIGLSLSQADASISAPFTGQTAHIGAMVELLKECRAGLATNFSLFNIMVTYSFIQFTSTLVCEIYMQQPADFQFMYWDFFMNFLFVLLTSRTASSQILSVQKPSQSLFNKINLLHLLIFFIIQMIGQCCSIYVFKSTNPEYYSMHGGVQFGRNRYNIQKFFSLDGLQSNCIFLFVNNIYIFAILAFNISTPWRKTFLTNRPFALINVLFLFLNSLIILNPLFDIQVFNIIHFNDLEIRAKIMWWSWIFGFLIYIVQRCIMEPWQAICQKMPIKIKWP